MRSYTRHYIDGAWVESDGGTRHEVINPATEAAVSEITLGSAADVDKAVAAAELITRHRPPDSSGQAAATRRWTLSSRVAPPSTRIDATAIQPIRAALPASTWSSPSSTRSGGS